MIDSHAHLGDEAFADDRDEMLARAKAAGLSAIVDICTDAETLQIGLELRQQYPWIHLAAATTPHGVGEEDPFFEQVKTHIDHLVAVGETGLDYYYEHAPRAQQQKWLRNYLELAHNSDLPVVIHCRDAFDDLFAILDEMPSVPGVLHCFTGTLDEARRVIDRGWYLSLSGIVTFKKSAALREVARFVPLDQLLIETDAPYLAPGPHRGKRCESAHVAVTATCIASERNVAPEELQAATAANAQRLFLRLS